MHYVYFVKPGDKNEELRYSLRSLERNGKPDAVWIVGYTPNWIQGVRSVRGNRYPGQKEFCVMDNTRLIAEHPDMPEDVVVMNDDFFLMKRYTPVVEYRGPLREQIAGMKNHGTWWGHSLSTTFDWLQSRGVEEPVSYELHKPILINRDKMAIALTEAAGVYPIPQWRTVYGNRWSPDATQGKDCKVRKVSEVFDKRSPLLSTEDIAFAQGEVGEFIRNKFPKPCSYEIPEGGDQDG